MCFRMRSSTWQQYQRCSLDGDGGTGSGEDDTTANPIEPTEGGTIDTTSPDPGDDSGTIALHYKPPTLCLACLLLMLV